MPETPATPLVSATIFSRTVIATARAAGADASRLLRQLDVSPQTLDDPEGWLPAVLVERFLELLGRTLDDEAPGLWVGEHVSPESADLLGYAMRTSKTLGEAYRTAARYYGVVGTQVEVYFRAHGDRSAFTHCVPPERASERRHRDELVMATLVTLGRAITGRSWLPCGVSFQQQPPENVGRHHSLFGETVRFGEPAMELSIDAETAELRCQSADETLHGILERYARSLVNADPEHPPLMRELRRVILHALPAGELTVEATARGLGMSSRTLQRRLRELGTTYGELLRQTRRYLAEDYLRSREVSIDEVAFLLGYANTPAFTRAFKQWTGMPPGRFRAAELGANG